MYRQRSPTLHTDKEVNIMRLHTWLHTPGIEDWI